MSSRAFTQIDSGLGIPPLDPNYKPTFLACDFQALPQHYPFLELADATPKRCTFSWGAEHEVTRLIHLVSAIADRLGVEACGDPELPELKNGCAIGNGFCKKSKRPEQRV